MTGGEASTRLGGSSPGTADELDDPVLSRAPNAVGALGLTTRQLVLAAAALMIGAYAGFRAWAIYPSWFFTDDYRLMLDARGRGLSWSYLVEPFDSQFMPLGRLAAWVVTDQGPTAWGLAATLALAATLLSALTCLWMLLTLFGARPAVLGLLAVYLTSALTLPGFMWWAAAVNQLPLQAVAFVAIGTWVRYLRRDGARWLAVTVLVLGVGLLAYVKTLLLLPVLAAVALGWFATGRPARRLRTALRVWWPAALASVPFAVFAVVYRARVPQPFTSAGADAQQQALGTADGMLATSLPTGLLGGPWTWFVTSPPTVLAEPPAWTVHMAWVLISALVAYAALRRRGTAKAWGLLAGYALVAFVLLATSRGQLFGRVAGQEYRYLTDVVPIALLAAGLALLSLRGAPGSSQRRETPLLVWRAPRPLVVGAVLAVAVGGLASSWQYVGFWHDDNAGRAYVKNLQGDLRELGPTDLADQAMPPAVMPEYTQPRNRTGAFVPLVAPRARFPESSDDLHVVGDDGHLRPATVEGTPSLPGPEPDCGWRVGSAPVSIPLEQSTFDFTWWVQIGYLSSGDDELTVQVAGSSHTIAVRRGLGTVWLQVDGAIDDISLGGLGSATMCVDEIEVGDVSARGDL